MSCMLEQSAKGKRGAESLLEDLRPGAALKSGVQQPAPCQVPDCVPVFQRPVAVVPVMVTVARGGGTSCHFLVKGPARIRSGLTGPPEESARNYRSAEISVRVVRPPQGKGGDGATVNAGLALSDVGEGKFQGGNFYGQGGIRTLDTLTGIPVFETGSFSHSDTCPLKRKSADEK